MAKRMTKKFVKKATLTRAKTTKIKGKLSTARLIEVPKPPDARIRRRK